MTESDPRAETGSDAGLSETETDPERHYEPEAEAPDVATEPVLEQADPATKPDVEVAPTTAAADVTPAAPPRARKRAPKPAPAPIPTASRAPYAIVETGGKQYRVSVGDRLAVERLTAEAGSEVTLDRVLLVGGTGATRVGAPTVAGATVTATVEDHYRGEKIVVFKYKAKKRYRRRLGHRQSLTRLAITGIAG